MRKLLAGLKESFLFSYHSLRVNKLRTFLSLLGITIGIFAIIAVFTVIGSLERNIRDSISSLGEDLVYVDKWPWEFSQEYPWWEYVNRPEPRAGEVELILQRSQLARAASYNVTMHTSVKNRDIQIDDIEVLGVMYSYLQMVDYPLASGRFFTGLEAHRGSNVAVLGQDMARELFPGENPIGKHFRLKGQRVTVIGLFDKIGSNMIGSSPDEMAWLPFRFMQHHFDVHSRGFSRTIVVKPRKMASAAALKDELRGVMRAVRRLRPMEKDDFALNRASMISKGFENIFDVMDTAGLLIGGFAILVGGFGIANIMFVSVREQTRLIGIQKALGAKRYFVLSMFLYEAILLSLLGGGIGLLLVFSGTLIAGAATDMNFVMSGGNITFGLALSAIVGVLAGFVPAYQAARLDPVEAMNTL